MTEPRKDTRRRDRAAYMRDYRAGRRKDAPTLTALAERVAALEAMLGQDGIVVLNRDTYERMSAPATRRASGFGSPRPAPKGK